MPVVSYPLRIVSTGRYLPRRHVTGEEVDARLRLEPGASAKMSGVQGRYYVDGERASDMGAAAVADALQRAGLGPDDVDALISCGGTPEQPIPFNAALIQQRLGWAQRPSFDVGATCMSFVLGLDVAGSLLAAGRYRRIALVAADVASCGLNDEETEAAILFGDAAAAVILEAGDGASRLLGAAFNTWPEGIAHTEIRGGGSALPATRYEDARRADYLFHMNGPRVFRLALSVVPPFVRGLLGELGLTVADLDLVIPHQASGTALELMRRRLDVDPARWVRTLHKYGNTIAASVPLAFDDCVREGRVKRGDRVLLLGTAAGFSAGVVVFEY
jgi:3-oxoacyl-[acyl-carrier-protein] synthase-3